MNECFGANFPESIFNFNCSALNGFSKKIFIAETMSYHTSGSPSIRTLMELYLVYFSPTLVAADLYWGCVGPYLG